jgi:hypothetical protein
MSHTDLWLKDLEVLESAWNEFLESGKVSDNNHQQLRNNDDDNNNVSGLSQPMLNINIGGDDDDDDNDDNGGKF